MNIKGENIYFLGIGGIGMSALARYFASQGKNVAGYDKTPSPLTDDLIAEGIAISFEDDPARLPFVPDTVIFTPAVPAENKIFGYLKNTGIPFMKRAAALGDISKDLFTIAVAGTHGKTTITSIITHLLKASGRKVTGFVGGICNNYNSNLILSPNPEIMVVEADEFDRSFLTLHPDIAVISSMDADHLDIYGSKNYLEESFFMFSRKIRTGGKLIICDGLKTAGDLKIEIEKYSVNGSTDIVVSDLRIENGKSAFTVKAGSQTIDIETFLPGEHNAMNIAAAAAASLAAGLTPAEIKEAIAGYTGVKRRFDIRVNNGDRVYIDDYAHHPREIEATLSAVRQMFPNKKVTVIFQPHLFSRTRDFMDDFARMLSEADEVWLMDIYPAREKPLEGVNSQVLLEKINTGRKQMVDFDNVISAVETAKPELLLTLGAGDIDRITEQTEEVMR
jgi:UDP-N-acetylmuramate--alanine ligase